MNARQIRKVRGVRPLFFSGNTLYCSRYNSILATDDLGETFRTIGSVPVNSKYAPLAKISSLVRRVLRMGIYRMRVLNGGNMVFAFKGGVYLLRAGETRAVCSFPVQRGSRPVSLAYKPGGMVVWGEYFNRVERVPVHIYGSSDCSETWQRVYSFNGEIRHIHGIAYDEYADCFWICTGDKDGEERLIRANADFSKLDVVLQGGQKNRFYSLTVTPDAVWMANDSPNSDNFLRRYDKSTGKVEDIVRLDNSSFYGCLVDGWYFCSTNSERPEHHAPQTFTQPNDYSATHIWMVNTQTCQARRVLSFPTDFWFKLSGLPKVHPVLFQFTRVFFPEGHNPTGKLVCHTIGTKGSDDCMMVYDLKDLEAAR